MRAWLGTLATILLLGCSTSGASGPSVSVLGGADTAESHPAPGARPDQAPDQTFSKTLYTSDNDDRADALLMHGEALAKKGDALRLVRKVDDHKVAPVSGGEAFESTPVPVRMARPGELTAGERIYFCHARSGDLRAARSAEWQEGTIDRIDPIFGRAVIGDAQLDPTTDVLVPVQ